MTGDQKVAPWRHNWLIALAALWAAQTTFRILFFSLAFYRSTIAAGLHLLFLGGLLSLIALIISVLPLRSRGRPIAAIVAAVLLGSVHAFITAFDIGQVVLYYYSGMGAPMMLIFTDPNFGLSLLASMGIPPWEALLVAALILGLHILLYVPVAAYLAGLVHRGASAGIPVASGRNINGRWPLAMVLALALITRFALPLPLIYLEYFHRGGIASFIMAPRALTIGAPGPDAPQPPQEMLVGARPVILIIVDAMRRDRMGVYDPRLDTTPFLTSLQQQGTLHAFPGAYSTCTFSFCGIMSILASRSWDSFTPRPPTLLDALAHYGYRNHIILSGSHSTFGKIYELYGRGVVTRTEHPDDEAVVQRIAAINFPDPQHSFLYIHLMSAHGGRLPPARFIKLARPGQNDFATVYDARIRAADEIIRQLFDQFRRKGLMNNALIVITADHGERLGERGFYFHGGPPDREATEIPVMIYDASRPKWPDRRLTSNIDIAPTVMRALGGAADPGWIGQPLQAPSRIPAIPLGTEEMTGTVATIDGVDYRYRCIRAFGREMIARVEPDRDIAIIPSRALLTRLRALHRQVAGPLPPGPCHL